MVEYGMPTLLELPNLEDCAKLCSELGLQFIELNMCLPQFQVEKLAIERLSGLSKQYNVYFTVHLDDTNTPCDFNPRIAEAYTATVLETIELAKQLRIPVLNMHLSLGTHFTLPDKKVLLFDEYGDTYLQNLTRFRNKCEDAISDAMIKICVENTRAFTHPIGERSLSLLLERPVFAITFDTGHDAREHYSQRPVIDKHIDRLCHMHLHDALVSEHRDHMTLGEGEIDLYERLKLADDHHCRVVMEVKTISGLRKSVEWMKHAKRIQ